MNGTIPRGERKSEHMWTLSDGTTVRTSWYVGKGLTNIHVTGPRALNVASHMHRR